MLFDNTRLRSRWLTAKEGMGAQLPQFAPSLPFCSMQVWSVNRDRTSRWLRRNDSFCLCVPCLPFCSMQWGTSLE